MYHVLWATPFQTEVSICQHYREYLGTWLHDIYNNIENEDISLSQCVSAYVVEQLLNQKNQIKWNTVLEDYLTSPDGIPMAYSKRFGLRLYKFAGQWKQSPIHAIYNHYWILSNYGIPVDCYAQIVLENIQKSGWIYVPTVSCTNPRTRMRSELMMNMAMGCELLKKANKLDSVANQLKATLASFLPTNFLSAEYYRLVALRCLDAEHLFVSSCADLLDKCRLETGFCDFNVHDKVDDYMGTKKRTERDRSVSSPLSTIYASTLLDHVVGDENKQKNVYAISSHKKQLLDEPFSIPAFKIRDIDVDFGSGLTAVEVIAAIKLINSHY